MTYFTLGAMENHQGFSAFGFFQQDSHTAGATGGTRRIRRQKELVFMAFGENGYGGHYELLACG
jgi:hypothetical protein